MRGLISYPYHPLPDGSINKSSNVKAFYNEMGYIEIRIFGCMESDFLCPIEHYFVGWTLCEHRQVHTVYVQHFFLLKEGIEL